jgi:site-specific DNA-methyltransferase (adenine-specific)
MKQEIWLGDCLELMGNIPDESVDLILIDPPYGMTAPKWDSIVSFDLLWENFQRIGKNGFVTLIFGSQPFTTKVISSNIKEFKYCWYWNKNQGTNFFHAKRMPIRKVEEICVFGGKTYYPQISEGHVPTQSAKGCSNGKAYHGTNVRDYEGGKTTRYPTNILDFPCVDNYSRVHSSGKTDSSFGIPDKNVHKGK